MLGKLFDGGHELSIGEWQKVALARAFLRDSQILILDEPTSAMDAKAEAELFGRFHELAKGRIAILMSHRLSTVKMVDRIYVLDEGRVLESGSHDELMRCHGLYASCSVFNHSTTNSNEWFCILRIIANRWFMRVASMVCCMV